MANKKRANNDLQNTMQKTKDRATGLKLHSRISYSVPSGFVRWLCRNEEVDILLKSRCQRSDSASGYRYIKIHLKEKGVNSLIQPWFTHIYIHCVQAVTSIYLDIMMFGNIKIILKSSFNLKHLIKA